MADSSARSESQHQEVLAGHGGSRAEGSPGRGDQTGSGGQMTAQEARWGAAAVRSKRYGDCGLEGMSAKRN